MPGARPPVGLDVLVVGEPLIELTSPEPLPSATTFTMSFSGDALNAAAAAAAAGARTTLLTRVGDDALGARLVRRIAELGVTPVAVAVDAPTGAYLSALDPGGTAEFVYLRRGSAASGLSPSDLAAVPLGHVGALLCSGVTTALSPGAADTVLHAARAVASHGGSVVYDPNYRSRLTTPHDARAALERIAPSCRVVTPSCPGDSVPLLGVDDPEETARRIMALGADAVVVTLGEHGLLVASDRDTAPVRLAPVPAAHVVDQTGAGDALAGTLAARLAAGDPVLDAARLGAAAAALSLAGAGGTGRVPTLAETRAALSGVPAG